MQDARLVDRSRLTLLLTGDELDPDEVSDQLSLAPTRSHRRGELRPSGRAWAHGAWQHTVEGDAPVGPDDLVTELFRRLPDDPRLWRALGDRFTVRAVLVVDVLGANRGFRLCPPSLARFAALGLGLEVEVWAYPEELSAPLRRSS